MRLNLQRAHAPLLSPSRTAHQPIIRTTTMTVAAAQPNSTVPAAAAPNRRPPSSSKTILLIRHGEGFHNIGYDHNADAHLTRRGWAQTAALRRHLATLHAALDVELVVVSPLRRTLETAAGVFGRRAAPAPTAAAAEGEAQWLLMMQQTAKPSEVTHQAALFLPPMSLSRRGVMAAAASSAAAVVGSGDGAGGGAGCGDEDAATAAADGSHHHSQQQQQPLKLLAHEGCRERIGPNVCDRFRDIPLQAAAFPGVDFSLVTHTTDEAWDALHLAPQVRGCYNLGESEEGCERRALQLYAWLLDRPESVIAVVTHCGWLVHGMRALGRGMHRAWSEAMVLQCAANSASMSLQGGHPSDDSWASGDADYAGGVDAGGAGGARGPSTTSSAAAAQVVDAAAAERLRVAAAEVSGRMALDWFNCECRAIQLRWGDASELLAAAAGGGAVSGGGGGRSHSGWGGVAEGGGADGGGGGGSWAGAGAGVTGAVGGGAFLYAQPAAAEAWWPGGVQGLN